MAVAAWRVVLRRRVFVVTALLGLWVAGIELRLVFLQVFSHAELVARAERQQSRTQDAPAARGDILDRRGRMLATSVDADTIYAVPSEIADPAGVAARLCKALRDCNRKEQAQIAERLGAQQRQFAYIRRQVSEEVKNLRGENDKLELASNYAPKTIATQCSFVKRDREFVITASGGVDIASWEVASKAVTDAAVGQVRQKAAPKSGGMWWN